jgi:hypothetical protein
VECCRSVDLVAIGGTLELTLSALAEKDIAQHIKKTVRILCPTGSIPVLMSRYPVREKIAWMSLT